METKRYSGLSQDQDKESADVQKALGIENLQYRGT